MTDGEYSITVKGVRLGTAAAGIRKPGRDDVLLIEFAEGSTCSAVFTTNQFCAAPIQVARQHLNTDAPRWLLINSGNANAGTGPRGEADTRTICRELAQQIGGKAEQVLPFSTGVIGEFLPVDRFVASLPTAVANLATGTWQAAAQAIMTTDTRPKLSVRRFRLGGHEVSVAGIAKGAGMIHPNMATMLAFVATDAPVAKGDLQDLLRETVEVSFNRISVDGDTSTNDACVLAATGQVALDPLHPQSPAWPFFAEQVRAVFRELAEAIVRDGEGATKLVRIQIEQAASLEEAHRVGNAVATSPLVKTALFASDPNWGRILAAVGRAGCNALDVGRVALWLGDSLVAEGGQRALSYTEAQGRDAMAGSEVLVRIVLGRGEYSTEVLTCDFSYDYVRINAEYRT